jgi:hypothetical protein
MHGIQQLVKKVPTEDEIRTRLRELSDAARKIREELEQRDKPSTSRLKGLVDDRPLRSSRRKRDPVK